MILRYKWLQGVIFNTNFQENDNIEKASVSVKLDGVKDAAERGRDAWEAGGCRKNRTNIAQNAPCV